jgi:hypothetical protein
VVSHFQAHRLASAYNASAPSSSSGPESISPGTTVLPASSVRRIQRSIRTGKLDSNGNLVGGEADSASDDESGQLQEMLELIRRGDIHNIGPSAGYTVPPSANQESSSPSLQTKTSASLKEVASSFQAKTLPPPSMLSKTSKFKVSREAAGKPSSTTIASGCNAPVLEARSSSVTRILHETSSTPAMTPPIEERNTFDFPAVARSSTTQIHSPNFSRAGSATADQILSRSSIADSSSLTSDGSHYTPSMPLMIIESPSFPQSQSSRRPDRPPTVLATDVKPKDPSQRVPTLGASPSFREVDQSYNQPNLSPTIMSSVVRESKRNQQQIVQAEIIQEPKSKKISRFRAERMS